MSVPIVGNKSLSSYECAAKLGPSDSLITSLSWVCLCCLNCCLLGLNIPRATVATATESHKRAKKALDPTQHVFLICATRQKGQAQRAGSAPVRSIYASPPRPPCSDPVSSTEEPLDPGHNLIRHLDPSRQTRSAPQNERRHRAGAVNSLRRSL